MHLVLRIRSQSFSHGMHQRRDLKAALRHHVMIYTTMQANYSFHVRQTSKQGHARLGAHGHDALALAQHYASIGSPGLHEHVSPHGKNVMSEAYSAIVDMVDRLGIAAGARDCVVERAGL